MHYDLILKALKMKSQCGYYATQQYLIKNGVDLHHILLILNRDGPKRTPRAPAGLGGHYIGLDRA